MSVQSFSIASEHILWCSIACYLHLQKTKRKSKPTIAQIFPSVELPHVSTPSDHEKSIVVEDEKLEKV